MTAQHRLLLKLKLLNRTTRSLTLTEAGERLIQLTGPALEKIVVGLEQLKERWDKPAGRIRLSADEYAIQYFLWPKLAPVLKEYPNIHLELITDYGLIDIARERFDAGARRGGLIAWDMVAIRTPDGGGDFASVPSGTGLTRCSLAITEVTVY